VKRLIDRLPWWTRAGIAWLLWMLTMHLVGGIVGPR
jgi:hypothetical protein